MKIGHDKIGRNEMCPCGSGSKYKHCCLPLVNNLLAENSPVSSFEIQNSAIRLKQQIQEHSGGRSIMHQGRLKIKMSEVILDLADELLEHAETKSQYKEAISITCLAWNLALLNIENQEQALEAMFNKIDNPIYRQDSLDLITSLIEKKNRLYPHINRPIFSFNLVGNNRNFHLNIISSISEGELNELS